MKNLRTLSQNYGIKGVQSLFYKMLFLFLFIQPSNLSASVLVCSLGDYFEKRYGYAYLYIDDRKLIAKLGTQKSWGEPTAVSKKEIAIGSKMYWSYSGYDDEYKRDVKFDMALRIDSSGSIDLLDISVSGRKFKLKNLLECKKS